MLSFSDVNYACLSFIFISKVLFLSLYLSAPLTFSSSHALLLSFSSHSLLFLCINLWSSKIKFQYGLPVSNDYLVRLACSVYRSGWMLIWHLLDNILGLKLQKNTYWVITESMWGYDCYPEHSNTLFRFIAKFYFFMGFFSCLTSIMKTLSANLKRAYNESVNVIYGGWLMFKMVLIFWLICLYLRWLGSTNFTKALLARSCVVCMRSWRPTFARIPLSCNYLGIIRGPPVLSLHNHSPDSHCLSFDLPSLFLFWMLISVHPSLFY